MPQWSNQHWFRKWLVACSAPSHYLNQSCNIVNWTHRNNIQWNLNRNSYIFIKENTFENVVWNMAFITNKMPLCNVPFPGRPMSNMSLVKVKVTWERGEFYGAPTCSNITIDVIRNVYIDVLGQDCCVSIVDALETLQFCTKPSIYMDVYPKVFINKTRKN